MIPEMTYFSVLPQEGRRSNIGDVTLDTRQKYTCHLLPSSLLVPSSKNCPILCQNFPLSNIKSPAQFSKEPDVKHLQQFLSCILKVKLSENCH